MQRVHKLCFKVQAKVHFSLQQHIAEHGFPISSGECFGLCWLIVLLTMLEAKPFFMDDKQWMPSIISLLMSFFSGRLSLLILSPMFPVTTTRRGRLLPLDEIYVGFNLLLFSFNWKVVTVILFYWRLYAWDLLICSCFWALEVPHSENVYGVNMIASSTYIVNNALEALSPLQAASWVVNSGKIHRNYSGKHEKQKWKEWEAMNI